jgi:CRP-like cAMP-binding protein
MAGEDQGQGRETAGDLFAKFPFFAAIPPEARLAISRRCVRKSYGPGEVLIGHKDSSRDVLFLDSGKARVNIFSTGGKQVSFRDVSAGAIFGELSAIDGQQRSASVECVTACAAITMPRQVFLESMEQHPPFMRAVLAHLTSQIRSLTSRVYEFSTRSVRNRVQAELLRIAGDPPPNANEVTIDKMPTHKDIADRISTHREAVTRELGSLEHAGLVAKEGRKLRLLNVKRLRMLAEEPSAD